MNLLTETELGIIRRNLLISITGVCGGVSLSIKPDGPHSIEEGRNVVLTCLVTGASHTLPVKWYGLDDKVVREDYR